MSQSVMHLTWITTGRTTHRPECSCGWVGPDQLLHSDAWALAKKHEGFVVDGR